MTDAPELFRCDDCGLHYTEKHLAEACYEHCITYRACSVSITAQSVERRRARAEASRPGGKPAD